MITSENVGTVIEELSRQILRRISEPPAPLINGKENDLVASDFQRLALLDMGVSELYSDIFIGLKMHHESVLRAEIELEKMKQLEATYIVKAFDDLRSTDEKLTEIRRHLSKGSAAWKTVEVIRRQEPKKETEEIEEKQKEMDDVAIKTQIPPCTSSTIVPPRPSVPVTLQSEFGRSMMNAQRQTTVAGKQQSIRKEEVSSTSHHTIEKPEAVERIKNMVLHSGSLDGSLYDHSGFDESISVPRDPLLAPNFDTESDEDDNQMPSVPKRPVLSSVSANALSVKRIQSHDETMDMTTGKTPVSSIYRPARPKMCSEMGKLLLKDENKSDNHQMEEHQQVENVQNVAITGGIVLPQRPKAPKFMSETAKQLFG